MAVIKANGHYILHVDDSVHEQTQSPIKNNLRHKSSHYSPSKTPFHSQEPPPYAFRTRLIIRIIIFIFCTSILFLARFNVPDNDVSCVVDKAMDWLQGVNDWILANHYWRDTLQIICSLFMDGMFLSLGAYWIYRGESSRLVVSVGVFYMVRAIVQGIWFSPYTKGFWWYDPGFPSIVVPYGRGSDFFFSGHIGFVTICALEWKKYGNMLMVYILAVGGVYTGFILIAYQVHYSIDLFVGVVFAHYVFIMVDHYKDSIDGFFVLIYVKGANMVGKAKSEKRKYEV